MDRLDNMRTFVRIVEAGTMSAAARALRLSLSAVSRQLAAAEERLGVQLLRRTTRRVALTEAGAAYYQACRRILAEIDEAEDQATGLNSAPRGTLVVDGPGTFGQRYLAPLMPRFVARNPELHVDLRLDDRFVDLFEERTDLLIRIGRVPDSTSVVAKRLAEHPRVVCASPRYLASRPAPVRPADLVHLDCIVLTRMAEPDLWKLQRSSETVAVRVRGRLAINSGAGLREAALADGGVILAPTWLVADDLRAGSLALLLPAWRGPAAPVHALYPRHRSASAKVRALVAYLGREWSRRSDWFV